MQTVPPISFSGHDGRRHDVSLHDTDRSVAVYISKTLGLRSIHLDDIWDEVPWCDLTPADISAFMRDWATIIARRVAVVEPAERLGHGWGGTPRGWHAGINSPHRRTR